MTEKELQANVVKLAQLLGFNVYHTYDSRKSEPGFPDLTMANSKRLVFAELKSERGRLTDEQKLWQNDLGSVENVEFHVWRPKDWLDGTIEKVLTAK